MSEEVSAALQRQRSALVSTFRRNALDTLVCSVRDCFGVLAPSGRQPPARHGEGPLSPTVGFPVDATDGTRSELCFGRRAGSGAKASGKVSTSHASPQGDGLAPAHASTSQAYLNTTRLLASLHLRAGAEAASALRQRGFGGFATLAYEDLAAFQLVATDALAFERALNRSIAAWQALLASWLVPSEPRPVRAALCAELGRTQPHPAPPPHRATIYNFDEVEAALRGASDARYAALIRP